MGIENLSLVDLANLESDIPALGNFPSRYLAKNSYSAWIEKLYEDIDSIIIKQIRPKASYLQDDPEDRFNMSISDSLVLLGYDSSHDTWSNGHPDIMVRDTGRGYTWLGESKIHCKYDHLNEGFKQLCERYSSGFEKESSGAVLIISKNKDIGKVMHKWESLITSDEFYGERNLISFRCKHNQLNFFTEHNHTTSSLSYRVKHIAIGIYHRPTDKSALNRKTKEK